MTDATNWSGSIWLTMLATQHSILHSGDRLAKCPESNVVWEKWCCGAHWAGCAVLSDAEWCCGAHRVGCAPTQEAIPRTGWSHHGHSPPTLVISPIYNARPHRQSEPGKATTAPPPLYTATLPLPPFHCHPESCYAALYIPIFPIYPESLLSCKILRCVLTKIVPNIFCL